MKKNKITNHKFLILKKREKKRFYKKKREMLEILPVFLPIIS